MHVRLPPAFHLPSLILNLELPEPLTPACSSLSLVPVQGSWQEVKELVPRHNVVEQIAQLRELRQFRIQPFPNLLLLTVLRSNWLLALLGSRLLHTGSSKSLLAIQRHHLVEVQFAVIKRRRILWDGRQWRHRGVGLTINGRTTASGRASARRPPLAVAVGALHRGLPRLHLHLHLACATRRVQRPLAGPGRSVTHESRRLAGLPRRLARGLHVPGPGLRLHGQVVGLRLHSQGVLARGGHHGLHRQRAHCVLHASAGRASGLLVAHDGALYLPHVQQQLLLN